MEGMILGVLNGVLKGLGISKIIALWEKQPELAVISGICIVLTMVWMFRMWGGRTASTLGKFPGSFAVAGIIVGVGIGLMIAAIHWAIGLAIGSIVGALRSVTIFGFHILGWLADLVQWVANSVTTLVVGIGIGVFILKSVQSIASQLFNAFKGAAQSWAGDGPNGVKWVYQLAGTIVTAAIVCNPEWNEKFYFIPSGSSALFGAFSLVWTTQTGRRWLKRSKAKMGNRPLPEGEWYCPHCGHFNEGTCDATGKLVAGSIPEACGECGRKNPYLPWDCDGDHSKAKVKGNVKPWEDIPWNNPRCPTCGKKRSAQTSKPSQPAGAPRGAPSTPAASPAVTPAAAPRGAAAATPATSPCPTCSGPVEVGKAVCRHCGYRIYVPGTVSATDKAFEIEL